MQSLRLDQFPEPFNSQTETAVNGSIPNQAIRYTQPTLDREDEPRWWNIGEESILIAVMGMAGTGKSTFISSLTGNRFPYTVLSYSWGDSKSMSFEKELQEQMLISADYPDSHKTKHRTTRIARPDFSLIDTPGLDDTSRDDTETLNEIARWLSDAYGDVSKISGALYLQQLSLDRSRIRNQLFRKYNMEENLHRRNIQTTLAWQRPEEDRKIKRLGDFNEGQ